MNDSPAHFEPADYFARVERQFGLRRGGRVSLSPRDWQLVEAWERQGIPVEVVLRGINRAFDQNSLSNRAAPRINSLAYCRQQVEECWEQHRDLASAGGTAELQDPSAQHLREAAAACRRGAVEGNPALIDAAEALDALAAQAASLTPRDLDRQAGEIEKTLESRLGDQTRRVALPRFSPWAV